jgi:ParB family transcriptional regulator, chromosome partitioning protein
MTTVTEVPFSALVASDAINARGATKDGIEALAASIGAKGLIQPLCVRPADENPRAGAKSAPGAHAKYEIIDGRRRYQAIATLVKSKAWKRDAMVPVLVRNEDDAEALESSLMANTVRLPMHPVDQHEVMARLAGSGLGEAEIAARFGISARTVRQHLALGRLAPDVRDAWRKGRIDTETAQAFAVHPDAEVQAALLKRLGRNVTAWNVRAQLAETRERVDQCDELALVGEDAYLAAGGTIDEDLFSDARYVADVPLARKLARDRLEAECARLRADGWAWAAIDGDPGVRASWAMTHVRDHLQDDSDESLPPEDYAADEKARSGCIVGIDNSYDWSEKRDVTAILIRTGLVRDEDEGASSAPSAAHQQPARGHIDGDEEQDDGADASAAELGSAKTWASEAPTNKPDDPFDVSGALTGDITTAQTEAACRALTAHPDLALRVLVAALTSTWTAPARVSLGSTAVGARRVERHHEFANRFETVRAWPDERVMAELAGLVGASLDLVAHNGVVDRANDIHLVAALPGADYLAAMRDVFSPADYFKRASRETAVAALREMADAGAIPPLAPDLDAAKKADLADAAAAQAKACGWLPPQVRHPAYTLLVAGTEA